MSIEARTCARCRRAAAAGERLCRSHLRSARRRYFVTFLQRVRQPVPLELLARQLGCDTAEAERRALVLIGRGVLLGYTGAGGQLKEVGRPLARGELPTYIEARRKERRR